MHDNPTLFRKPAMAHDPANGTIPAVPLPDADAELGRRFKAWGDAERQCDQQPSAAENTPLDAGCRAALWRFYHEPARTPAGAALKLATLMPSIVGVLISDTYADVVDACNDPACHNIDEMAPVSALDDLLRLAEAEAADRAADAELVAAVDEVFSLSAQMAAVDDEADDAPEFVALQRRWVDLIHKVIRMPAAGFAGLGAKARLAHHSCGEFDHGELLPIDGDGWRDDIGHDVLSSFMRDAVRLGGRASA